LIGHQLVEHADVGRVPEPLLLGLVPSPAKKKYMSISKKKINLAACMLIVYKRKYQFLGMLVRTFGPSIMGNRKARCRSVGLVPL
jgi:hypothetical protein